MANAKNNPQLKYNFLDNVVRFFSPNAALHRAQARLALNHIDKAFGARRFDASSRGPRFSQWKRPASSADSALTLNLPLLRNGSRDLTRNNSWAEKALTVIENNTVGTGILASISHKDEAKAEAAQELWDKWAMSNKIDASDRLDLVAIQEQAIRTIAEAGEVIIRRRYRRASAKYPIPIQIQVLEPDHLDSSRDGDLGNGSTIKNGIEFNKQDKRVAYWLFPHHPGDDRSYRNNYQSIRIPARDIIHAYDPKRAGQNRGYPWVATAVKRLKDFDDYEDAQLVRQKIASCFSIFIHDMNDSGAGATGLDHNEEKEDDDFDHVQPGIVERLPLGKDVKFASPPGVTGYGEYATNILRAVAAGYGITYESMTGDYTKSNFSSSRMGWLEMSRNVNRWQNSIMRLQVLERLAEWFIGGAMLNGDDFRDVKFKWRYPRREMIDPTKEVPAIIKSIRGGLTSLQRVHASMGYSSAEVIEEIEKMNETLDEKDIVLDTDPRRVSVEGSDNSKISAEIDGETKNSDDKE